MINFLPSSHPLQNLTNGLANNLEQKLVAAQDSILDLHFPDCYTFLKRVFDDVKILFDVAEDFRHIPLQHITELPYPELLVFYRDLLLSANFPDQSILFHATTLAQQTKLLQAFEKPEQVIEYIEAKVLAIVNTFPKTVKDIEVGRNPGDVLDPYILTATQYLLCEGAFKEAIGATVAHKALMIIEGLLGHLHEDVIGMMRGNVRVPEPRAKDRETINIYDNAFPGADVMQPPLFEGDSIKFHQIKSKTGSAKGGDAVRLGTQLQNLQDYYGGEVFYHALIGNTLKGHRSMTGVISKAPKVIVLVGHTSFNVLTRSNNGPELLLRIYQAAFRTVSAKTGYSLSKMSEGIITAFSSRPEVERVGFLETILKDVTIGNITDQDSRTYKRGRGPTI